MFKSKSPETNEFLWSLYPVPLITWDFCYTDLYFLAVSMRKSTVEQSLIYNKCTTFYSFWYRDSPVNLGHLQGQLITMVIAKSSMYILFKYWDSFCEYFAYSTISLFLKSLWLIAWIAIKFLLKCQEICFCSFFSQCSSILRCAWWHAVNISHC